VIRPGTHELNKAVDERFAEADVDVPLPQRDVHLHGGGACEHVDGLEPTDGVDPTV
jgi:small-conductance mechanosensitive channel